MYEDIFLNDDIPDVFYIGIVNPDKAAHTLRAIVYQAAVKMGMVAGIVAGVMAAMAI